ncbi:unnamed protein product [Brachionus calyciflorus]|uniref:Uncharacterized protein n=1 Tax=Brachionus calyciflorus TaxID=104777 RepID=A0A813ZKZ4_9BILA|nr:unnamed protein product [Brachionus calyciflorus]
MSLNSLKCRLKVSTGSSLKPSKTGSKTFCNTDPFIEILRLVLKLYVGRLAKIIVKIRNFYISKNFSWRLRDLSMDYWCKEMRLMFKNNLTNEPDELSLENKNLFLIKFYLKDEKSSNLI